MPADPDLIRAARALLGMSQAKLAEKAGIAPKTLWKIEAGDLSISVENYRAVTRALENFGIMFLAEGQGDGAGIRRTPQLQAESSRAWEEVRVAEAERKRVAKEQRKTE
ncbi:helix-turn-helix domain-containing protein [Aureimonas ureilytica]|uniref:helix-turn-helix domain-containing protein n=1 Tax=Aureimonas ureilytica TaxID=401562 RepID=UPI00039D1B64|nr:helix-turn-helix transcriptional regulator [Aureimonas ureilytica]